MFRGRGELISGGSSSAQLGMWTFSPVRIAANLSRASALSGDGSHRLQAKCLGRKTNVMSAFRVQCFQRAQQQLEKEENKSRRKHRQRLFQALCSLQIFFACRFSLRPVSLTPSFRAFVPSFLCISLSLLCVQHVAMLTARLGVEFLKRALNSFLRSIDPKFGSSLLCLPGVSSGVALHGVLQEHSSVASG